MLKAKLAYRALFVLCIAAWLSACQVLFGEVTIERSPPGTSSGACTVGSFRCNSEFLLSCDGSSGPDWFLKETCASAERCDSKLQKCQTCKPGDLRCMGAVREECSSDGTAWLAKLPACDSASQCNPTGCFPCIPKTHQCRGPEGRELWECDDSGEWTLLVETCVTDALCKSSAERADTSPNWERRCDPPGCTEAGKYMCTGTLLQRCRQDLSGWAPVDTCLSKELCDKAATLANESPAGGAALDMCPRGCEDPQAHLCDGMTLKSCAPDLTGWVPQMTCPPGTECNPDQGTCSALCDPGATQCNGAQLRRCSPQRTWEVLEDCKSDALCQASLAATSPLTTPHCIPPTCPTAGDYYCDGARPFKCNNDLTQWEPQPPCDSAALCEAQNKRCRERACDPGQLRCFDNELRRCRDDLTQFDPYMTCGSGKFCSDSSGSEGCWDKCPTGTVCSNGTDLWECGGDPLLPTNRIAACITSSLCVPGQRECKPPICSVGEEKCENNKLLRCSAGRDKWDVTDCNQTQTTCVSGTAMSPGVCARCPANASECNGNTLRYCSSDRTKWETRECVDKTPVCDAANRECDACVANSTTCDGQTLVQCDAQGHSATRTTCTGTTPVCDAAGRQCDVCTAKSARCSGNVLYTCNDTGQKETATECATAQLCDAVDGCKAPVCAKGDTRCNGAQPEVCNAGRTAYVAMGEPCATKELCVGSTGTCTPPACAANGKQCDGAQPQVCNAGRTAWVNSGTACATAALCVSGACKNPTCAATDFQCDGSWLQTCNAGRTDFENNKQCGRAALCDAKAGRCKACLAGEFSCDGAKLQTCNDTLSGWNDVTTCTAANLCDATNGECDECLSGDKKCDGNKLLSCDTAGHFVLEVDCDTTAQNCSDDEKACVLP
ncbi:MAG TPA: hypothetical protein VFQ61_08455 [Polyangiaceae bacterium]|nr:hypothetical protein [Polyangiaceae bacterium]